MRADLVRQVDRRAHWMGVAAGADVDQLGCESRVGLPLGEDECHRGAKENGQEEAEK